MATKKSTAVKVVAPEVTIDYLLSLEQDVHDLAEAQGDYPNVDAVKARLKGIEQQIGALGNTVQNLADLEVPDA
jgi:hypothetical protein